MCRGLVRTEASGDLAQQLGSLREINQLADILAVLLPHLTEQPQELRADPAPAAWLLRVEESEG